MRPGYLVNTWLGHHLFISWITFHFQEFRSVGIGNKNKNWTSVWKVPCVHLSELFQSSTCYVKCRQIILLDAYIELLDKFYSRSTFSDDFYTIVVGFLGGNVIQYLKKKHWHDNALNLDVFYDSRCSTSELCCDLWCVYFMNSIRIIADKQMSR